MCTGKGTNLAAVADSKISDRQNKKAAGLIEKLFYTSNKKSINITIAYFIKLLFFFAPAAAKRIKSSESLRKLSMIILYSFYFILSK